MPSLRSHLFRALIKATAPRTLSLTSLPELRARMAALSSKQPLPKGVDISPAKADGVPVEWFTPTAGHSQSVILYLHGGAWTLGWTNTGRSMLAHLCLASQCRALAVDYRLAPEHPFPDALEDCLTVYRWLLNNGTARQQIVIAGDSAGGNLALATLLGLRDSAEPLPAAAVCISAVTDLAFTGESLISARDPSITVEFAQAMARHYIGGRDPHQPLISPLYGRMDGLPPLLIHAGEDEIFLSDAVRLAEHARSAAVDVRLVIGSKMWHVWHAFAPYLPEAQQAIKEIGAFIREHAAA